jgi:hypothetical protein
MSPDHHKPLSPLIKPQAILKLYMSGYFGSIDSSFSFSYDASKDRKSNDSVG